MRVLAVSFHGGPFDGLVWPLEAPASIEGRVHILLDPTSRAVALYVLRDMGLGQGCITMDYAYEETVRP